MHGDKFAVGIEFVCWMCWRVWLLHSACTDGVKKSDDGGLSCQCGNRENVTCTIIMIGPFVFITIYVLSLSSQLLIWCYCT